MKAITSVLLGLCLAVASESASAGAREQMQAFTRGLTGLDARFEQRVYDPNGRQSDLS